MRHAGQTPTRVAAMNLGPYATAGEATFCLGRFADAAGGPGLGLIWSDGTACTLLRKPQYDADGFGYSLIVEWRGGRGAPPLPQNPTMVQRVVKFFEDAITASGERKLAELQSDMAIGQEVSTWLGNKDHEHAVSFGFDILAIVCVAMLFIPVVGEVEMAVGAVVEGGEALATAAKVTGVIAGGGAMLGAYVDGRYLGTRYFVGADAAKEWDESPQAATLSMAAAILALPDFAVGGVMLVQDVGRFSKAATAARESTEALRTAEAAKAAKAQSLLDRIPEEPAWKAKHLVRKSGEVSARAAKFGKKADEAAGRAMKLQYKIYTLMLLNAPSTFIGTPTAEAYFKHDNPHLNETLHTASKWLGALLVPDRMSKSVKDVVHNIVLRVGVSSRTQNEAQ
jgi:hypothetical protein